MNQRLGDSRAGLDIVMKKILPQPGREPQDCSTEPVTLMNELSKLIL